MTSPKTPSRSSEARIAPDSDDCATELFLFGEGRNTQSWRFLGAHRARRAGRDGVRFRVWAPNAGRVSVIGDFNQWDGARHPMRSLG